MEKIDALGALAALAQETRLDIFRLLVASGPDGLAAGHIAARMGLQPATLSFHLKELKQAGLVTCRKDGLRVYYRLSDPRILCVLDQVHAVSQGK